MAFHMSASASRLYPPIVSDAELGEPPRGGATRHNDRELQLHVGADSSSSNAPLAAAALQPQASGGSDAADVDDDGAASSSARRGGAAFVTAHRAVLASWLVNWFLLVAKIVVFVSSRSKAVLAALTDSAVDLASQAVLSVAERYMKRHDTRYPVGRARLEALGVLGCATIMSMASVEVVQYSIIDLVAGVRGEKPQLDVGWTSFTVLGVGTGAKALLWLACRAASRAAPSDTLEALAEDHLNDVWSNTGAIVAGAVASARPAVWWLDPAGAIVISALIILRWASVIWEQVKKVVGHTAPDEFVARVNALAASHSPQLAVDVTRAYHFGSRYIVEMEVVLPGHMTVRESHDIALALQHKIEALEEVERAFVHVDYERRDGLEHKAERELVLGAAALGSSSGSHSAAPSAAAADGLHQRRGPSAAHAAP